MLKVVSVSNLTYVTQDVALRRLFAPTDGYVSLDYDILVLRSFAPSAGRVESELKAGILKSLKPRNSTVYLDDSIIVLDGQSIDHISVIG